MGTAIIFLYGSTENKKKFDNTIKTKYKVWNDAIQHCLNQTALRLGYDEKFHSNVELQEFTTKLSFLADDYFNFSYEYLLKKIELAENSNINVIVFHDVNSNLVKELGDETDKPVLEIHLGNNREDNDGGVRVKMDVNDVNFGKDIFEILNILTK